MCGEKRQGASRKSIINPTEVVIVSKLGHVIVPLDHVTGRDRIPTFPKAGAHRRSGDAVTRALPVALSSKGLIEKIAETDSITHMPTRCSDVRSHDLMPLTAGRV